MNGIAGKIDIRFFKVKGHSGIEYNERVDRLAKESLTANSYKTYQDGSVRINGISSDQWKEILEGVQCEYRNDECRIKKETIGGLRIKYIITSPEDEKVTVNCYNSLTAYVQGSNTPFRGLIIEAAISYLTDYGQVVEVLNGINGTKADIGGLQQIIESRLPHYVKGDKKVHATILCVVYYSQSKRVMPEYSSFLVDVYRIADMRLHVMLNSTGEHICGPKDKYDMFGLPQNGVGYVLTDKKIKDKLSDEKIKTIEEMYNIYAKQRNQIFHMSDDYEDNRSIESREEAQDLIEDALEVIDRSYELFG